MLKAGWQNLSIDVKPERRSIWFLFLAGVMIIPYGIAGALPVFISLCRLFSLYRHQIIKCKFNRLLIALSLCLIAISGFSLDPLDSLVASIHIIPFFLFFATYRYLFDRPQLLKTMSRVVVLGSLPLVILGFGQLWWGWDILLKIGSIELINLRPYGLPQGRMSSIFFHANMFADYLQAIFIFALGLWADKLKNIDVRTQRKSLEFYCLTAYLPIVLLALILTSSRTAWAAAIVHIVAMTVYIRWYWLLGAIAAVTATTLGAAFAPVPARTSLQKIVPAYFWARINDSMYPNRPVADTRESLFQFAYQLTLDRPLTGWGLQTFGNLYRTKTGLYLNHPHNVFLTLSYAIGLPMTVFFVSTIGYIFYQVVRFWIELPTQWQTDRTIVFTYLLAAVGLTIVNLTDLTIFLFPINFLFWAILTALYGLVIASK